MYQKRFIYRNGKLIPKKIDYSVPNNNIFITKENNDKINKKSRNNNLNYHDNNNISSKSQCEEDKLFHKNNDNEEIQNNKNIKIKNTITEENYFSNNNQFKKNIKNPKKLSLYSQIEHICNHIYLSPTNKYKENIFIEMYQKENDFVKKLNENFLIRDAIIRKKYYSRNFPRLIKYSSSLKAQAFNQYLIKYKANEKNNKTNKEEIIKKENDEEKNITLDINNKQKPKNNEEILLFNYMKYKHPQIYKLKSENKIKLPKIKKELNKEIDLESLIPVKRGIKKDEKISEYMFYKVMKQNRLKKFHI